MPEGGWMPAITNPKTRQRLQKLGCLIENRVDGVAMAKLLAERLETNHIAATEADIATVERTVGQLVADLIGTPDDEVTAVARGLLAVTDTSRVQKALSNGYALLGRRVPRQVMVEGEARTVSVGTRFLTADHDLIRRYWIDPTRVREERRLRQTRGIAELLAQRQSGMAIEVTDFLRELSA